MDTFQALTLDLAQEMSRALFIFAKLNPGLTYVQGMNELYAPLYYLCAQDTYADGGEHAGQSRSHACCRCDSQHDCRLLQGWASNCAPA